MNRSYGAKPSYNNNKPGQNKPKVIYSDQEIFAGQTKSGEFYLFHTTADPDEQFKMRKIGSLAEKPPRQYVEEKVVYGQAGEKIKWRLDKEKVREWIEDEYNFGFSDEPSPWAPKKLGEKRARPTPTAATASDDSDTDSDNSASSQPPAKMDSATMSKRVEDCYLLLQEIVGILRHDNKINPVGDTL